MRGYTPFGREHAKDSKFPDLKEFWHIGRELSPNHKYTEFYPNNVWPSEIVDFEKNFLTLYNHLDKTGNIMLEALTAQLKLPKNYFQDMTRDGDSILRLLHYPPLEEGCDPNCLRAAPHEDINLITLLVAAEESGLELLNRDNEWMPVETKVNNIIVDAGDMLSRITNGVIPSTTHRVVNPKTANVSRYSMPFFIHPNPDAVLSCLPSCRAVKEPEPDILAHKFLQQRLEAIGLLQK